MKLSMALLLTVAAPAAAGGWVTAAALEDGGKQLVLMTRSGPKSAPREADQVGFSQPRVSSDGQYAGWLVLLPNCCTSYPISLTLIVMGPRRSVHRFEGPQATFGWCFAESAAAVVYRRAALHGAGSEYFEMRSLRDGRLLRRHETPTRADLSAVTEAALPQWAQCAAQ